MLRSFTRQEATGVVCKEVAIYIHFRINREGVQQEGSTKQLILGAPLFSQKGWISDLANRVIWKTQVPEIIESNLY